MILTVECRLPGIRDGREDLCWISAVWLRAQVLGSYSVESPSTSLSEAQATFLQRSRLHTSLGLLAG